MSSSVVLRYVMNTESQVDIMSLIGNTRCKLHQVKVLAPLTIGRSEHVTALITGTRADP